MVVDITSIGQVAAGQDGRVGRINLVYKATDQLTAETRGAAMNLRAQAGVIGDGVADDATAINSAATSAASLGVRLYATGTFKIGSTVNIVSAADLSNATFNWVGTTGPAVFVGHATSGSARGKLGVIELPHVVNTWKVSTGWAQTNTVGSVGVKIQNLATTEVSVTEVKGFETGLLLYGLSQGVVHNLIKLYALENNKVNLKADTNGAGWINQNTFLGGRFSHDSAEGASPVSGTKHIYLTRTVGAIGGPNGNTFVGCSLESANTVQYCIDLDSGTFNRFYNCRFEIAGGTPAVRWGAEALYNAIDGGNNSDAIVETVVSGASANSIVSNRSARLFYGSKGALYENYSSSGNPIFTFMRAGGVAAGDDPTTAYVAKISANLHALKQYTDTNDRIQLDGQNGRIYFGSGSATPVRYLANAGTTGISVNGGNFNPGADNTLDSGTATSRWRYVSAGTAVRTGATVTGSRPSAATAGAGAMAYDTTLSKPIWSDGTVWRDAAGTAV